MEPAWSEKYPGPDGNKVKVESSGGSNENAVVRFLAGAFPDSRQYFVDGSDSSSAHELTHGLNSFIRNSKGGRVNACFFYQIKSAFILVEPSFSKESVYVPFELRGPRYRMYVTESRDWTDRPLYILDEFSAYWNGMMAAEEELKTKGKSSSMGSDICMGPVEFLVYSLFLAAKAKDEEINKLMRWAWTRCLVSSNYAQTRFHWPDYLPYMEKINTNEELRAAIKEVGVPW